MWYYVDHVYMYAKSDGKIDFHVKHIPQTNKVQLNKCQTYMEVRSKMKI
jgi:hypothetical protein